MIAANGQARTIRLLTEAVDIGFGLSDVRIQAGAEANLGHKNCLLTNHIISGSGEATDVITGQSWKLEGSMAYNVRPEDRHRFCAHTDIHLLSVFPPPLAGE